ncbi:hypothetical protein CYLTODRAFT_427676, partial [Cylindrobasidium torrendii FP15055 ss-10]
MGTQTDTVAFFSCRVLSFFFSCDFYWISPRDFYKAGSHALSNKRDENVMET